MLLQLRAIIALTIKEIIRRKLTYFLILICLLYLIVVSSFQPFKLNVQFRLIKDLSLSGIEIIGILSTFVVVIPLFSREIEMKTLFPILAKPISRSLYLTGRMIGSAIAITTIWLVLTIEINLLLFFKGQDFSLPLLYSLILLLFEFYVLLVWVSLFSSFVSPPLNVSIATMVYVIGNFSYFFKDFLLKKVPMVLSYILKGIFLIIPNFTFLHTHDAVVHDIPVSNGYYLKVMMYVIVYIACLYQIAIIAFEKKDIN
ncbi:MAG: hypothetical protein JXA60_08245 [Candidatus Coatesbacteria bacterium]|nr:hypothetical protein [Candidatus Coatesbacteria bacterium]